MPDLKITELTAISGMALADLLAVVRDPSGSPATRKATLQQVLDLIGVSLNLKAAGVLTTETQPSNTAYGDLATAGPAVTLTLTGTLAIVWLSATVSQPSAGNSSFLSVAVSGATTIAASHDNAAIVSSAGASYDNNLSRVVALTGLTPGSNTFTVKYSNNGGGTWSFSRRTIAVFAP